MIGNRRNMREDNGSSSTILHLPSSSFTIPQFSASFRPFNTIYIVEGATIMKKLIAITIVLSVLLGASALAATVGDELNIPVKKLYSAPLDGSNQIYEIPVEVVLLDISEDGNWYKVKISYWVVPFNYTYVGWTHIPVEEIRSKRNAEYDDIAGLIKE